MNKFFLIQLPNSMLFTSMSANPVHIEDKPSPYSLRGRRELSNDSKPRRKRGRPVTTGGPAKRLQVSLGDEEIEFVKQKGFAEDRWHSDVIRQLVRSHPEFKKWAKERG